MKENIKEIKIKKQSRENEQIMAIICHISVAIISFVAANARVMSSLTPFGLSFVAGCPSVFTAASATGAFLGYFFAALKGGAFKYIAALFLVLSVKLLLSSYKRLINNPFILSGL